MTPTITKNNYIKITLKKYTYKSENILITPIHTKNIIMLKKHAYKSHTPNMHITPFLTKNNF